MLPNNVKNTQSSSEWITKVKSQAATEAVKQVTARWNLTAFILIKMALHSCTIFMKEHFIIQTQTSAEWITKVKSQAAKESQQDGI